MGSSTVASWRGNAMSIFLEFVDMSHGIWLTFIIKIPNRDDFMKHF